MNRGRKEYRQQARPRPNKTSPNFANMETELDRARLAKKKGRLQGWLRPVLRKAFLRATTRFQILSQLGAASVGGGLLFQFQKAAALDRRRRKSACMADFEVLLGLDHGAACSDLGSGLLPWR